RVRSTRPAWPCALRASFACETTRPRPRRIRWIRCAPCTSSRHKGRGYGYEFRKPLLTKRVELGYQTFVWAIRNAPGARVDGGVSMQLRGVNLTDPDIFEQGVPHEMFRILRREAPVYWHEEPDGPGFWAITKYHDLKFVSKNP